MPDAGQVPPVIHMVVNTSGMPQLVNRGGLSVSDCGVSASEKSIIF